MPFTQIFGQAPSFRIAEYFKVIFLLLVVLTLTNCLPVLRSSHGLRRGEFQVSYNAPLAGDVRVGLTDKIEYRYSIIGVV